MIVHAEDSLSFGSCFDRQECAPNFYDIPLIFVL